MCVNDVYERLLYIYVNLIIPVDPIIYGIIFGTITVECHILAIHIIVFIIQTGFVHRIV